MAYTEETTQPTFNVTVAKTATTEQLLAGLYSLWDAADRAQLQLFLTGRTAKEVVTGQPLSGDKLTVGVRRNEWESGQGRIFRTALEHDKIGEGWLDEKKTDVLYDMDGAPVHLKIYEDEPTITNLDTVFYKNETFYIPNPLKTFEKEHEDE